MTSRWFDTHCHPVEADMDNDLADAVASSVGGMVVVGTDVTTSQMALDYVLAMRERASTVLGRSTVGVHPHDAKSVGEDGLRSLEEILERDLESLVVGVGECGLDYFYDHSPRDIQQEVFKEHIALAQRHRKTLVIHTRDAWDDTFKVLGSSKLPDRIIFHCFIGGVQEMQRAVELGAFISFSGIVTFKNSRELQDVAKVTPIERILVETDSPYLAPVPLRGSKNAPKNVALTGEFVANLRNISAAELQDTTWLNAMNAFGITN